MSWDSVSDFEINKAVAKLQGLNNIQPYNGQSFVSYEEVDYDTLKYYMETVDYCNSWADMGSIALSSNIVITPCMGSNKGDATGYFEHENPITKEFEDNNEALRAAAIVYLMMNGVRWEDLV